MPAIRRRTQFYGLGACAYGPYEVGTLWIYATDPERSGTGQGSWAADAGAGLCAGGDGVAPGRAGDGVHSQRRRLRDSGEGARKTLTQPSPAGRGSKSRHTVEGEWDCGNLQAASQPVFLDDEIRYYYAGTNVRHSRHWELEPQEAGMGMARLKPDRFVALRAGEARAELGTIAFKAPSVEVFVNARTAADGEVRVELQDEEARPLAGFTAGDCRPINWGLDGTPGGVARCGPGRSAGGAADADPGDGAAGQRVFGVCDGAGRVARVSPIRRAAAGE